MKPNSEEINESLDCIDDKQALYEGMLSGEIKNTSNLIDMATRRSEK